jgi:hypothetical protein
LDAVNLGWKLWTFITDLGEGHPLFGRRMPDLDLVSANGPLRVSPCCTMPGRCYSTSVSPAASTSNHGQIAFS